MSTSAISGKQLVTRSIDLDRKLSRLWSRYPDSFGRKFGSSALTYEVGSLPVLHLIDIPDPTFIVSIAAQEKGRSLRYALATSAFTVTLQTYPEEGKPHPIVSLASQEVNTKQAVAATLSDIIEALPSLLSDTKTHERLKATLADKRANIVASTIETVRQATPDYWYVSSSFPEPGGPYTSAFVTTPSNPADDDGIMSLGPGIFATDPLWPRWLFSLYPNSGSQLFPRLLPVTKLSLYAHGTDDGLTYRILSRSIRQRPKKDQSADDLEISEKVITNMTVQLLQNALPSDRSLLDMVLGKDKNVLAKAFIAFIDGNTEHDSQ